MKNILLTLNYDGKNYHGWQIQENALTVQDVFQKALKNVTGEEPNIKGCSRTDSGVHANMYCVSLNTKSNIPIEKIPIVLNKYLPEDVAVQGAVEVPLNFHARYSCRGKEYIYKIWNGNIRNPFLNGYAFHYWYKMDINLLNEAASYFIGTHDFTSFCTKDKRKSGNMERTIRKFEVIKQDELVTLSVEADGFLYNMVRIMVGTLLQVVSKRINPLDIKKILLAKDRSKAGPTAVPYGLYLNKVFYKGEKSE